MRTKTQRNFLLIAIGLLKYLPVISTIGFISHAVLGLNGISHSCLDNIVYLNIPVGVFLLICSVGFGFCRLHRLFIYYGMLCSLLMFINEDICPIGPLWIHRCVSIAIGTFLLIALMFKFKSFNRFNDVKKLIGTITKAGCEQH